MFGELLLTLVIALLVIHPRKWPTLAHHIAKCIQVLERYKQKSIEFWQAQLNLYQLEENKKKAAVADDEYGNNR
jgi:Sec-independent protein translocase protein TatA